jgi:hypothetical protein
MAQVQAGWYPDPAGDTTRLRYWDGNQWTNDYTAAASPQPQPQPQVVVSETIVTPVGGNQQRVDSTYTQAPAQQSNGMAVASLVLGIIGLCIGICAIIAIVLAISAKKRPGGQGLATAGLVLGIIGAIGWVVVLIINGTGFLNYLS